MPARHARDEDGISDPTMVGRDVGGPFDFGISVGEHDRPATEDYHEIYQLEAVVHQFREPFMTFASERTFEPSRYARRKRYDAKSTNVGSLRIREEAHIRDECCMDGV